MNLKGNNRIHAMSIRFFQSVFTGMLLLVFIFSQTCLGDGIVTVTLNNRGDLTITGDNFDNSLFIYVVFPSQQEIAIEAFTGTVTLIKPNSPPITDSIVYLDRDEIEVVRNLRIDLRGGDNFMSMAYLPPIILGNFRVDMGRGINQMNFFPFGPVEIFRSIDARGSRTADGSVFFLDGNIIFSPVLARQVSANLGGNNSHLVFEGVATSGNFSARTRGVNSYLGVIHSLVVGRLNLQSRGDGHSMIVRFSDFVGRASIRSQGDGCRVWVEKSGFLSDADFRMGNFFNQMELEENEFHSSRRSRFRAGRGENALIDILNFFQVPPNIRGFNVLQ